MKYELGQIVWYMANNKVCNGTISSRMAVENSHDDWAHTDEQKTAWQNFGPSRVIYCMAGTVRPEAELFKSKEDLLASL